MTTSAIGGLCRVDAHTGVHLNRLQRLATTIKQLPPPQLNTSITDTAIYRVPRLKLTSMY